MRWPQITFQRKDKAPTHGEIRQRVDAIKSGEDSASIEIKNQKTQFKSDLQKINNNNKMVERGANKTKKIIDTAIAIALASGGLQYEQL